MNDFFCFIASLFRPNIQARKTSNVQVYLYMKSLRGKLTGFNIFTEESITKLHENIGKLIDKQTISLLGETLLLCYIVRKIFAYLDEEGQLGCDPTRKYLLLGVISCYLYHICCVLVSVLTTSKKRIQEKGRQKNVRLLLNMFLFCN